MNARPRRPLAYRLARTFLAAIAIVAIAAVVAFDIYKIGGVDLPSPPKIDRLISVPQNRRAGWDDQGLDWFHHANQGTRLLPYDWFISLRQPEIGILHTPGRVAEPDYLRRFGFLPDLPHKDFNPDGLPIGFAVDPSFREPDTDEPPYKVVGLTCAACHTGLITYRDGDDKTVGVLIEGGSSMVSLRLFQEAVGRALYYTEVLPWRFDAFARDVLERQHLPNDAEHRAALRARLRMVVERGQKERRLRKRTAELEHGFSRTDALSLIGNRVFGTLDETNLSVSDAPVNFPPLWDTPWFDRLQYNGSIRMPMVRDIGQALGVGALVNLDPHSPRMFESTINVPNLRTIETILGGDDPSQGLTSPSWSAAGLPPIDRQKSEDGRKLYDRFCVQCHLTPWPTLVAERDDSASPYWTSAGDAPYDKRFLKTHLDDLEMIGTDKAQALNLYRRVASAGTITVPAVFGLQVVTEEIRDRSYRPRGLFSPGNESSKANWDRWRKHVTPEDKARMLDRIESKRSDDVVSSPLKYRARPLDGVWSTPPYLHNGSVPNLYQMLVPQTERDPTFYLGRTEFDPVRVGYLTSSFPGGWLMDTSKSGNRNTGHEFRNLTLDELEKSLPDALSRPGGRSVQSRWAALFQMTDGQWALLTPEARHERVRALSGDVIRKERRLGGIPGVIGAELTVGERWAIVEYLKTL